MNKIRLEAFSDAVIAIIIAIMVLELKVPHGETAESLIPFTTGWMGENHSASLPTALYGVVLLMAAIAYYILQGRLIASQGKESLLRAAVGSDWNHRIERVLARKEG